MVVAQTHDNWVVMGQNVSLWEASQLVSSHCKMVSILLEDLGQ